MSGREPEHWLDIIQHRGDLALVRELLAELNATPRGQREQILLAVVTAIRIDQLGKVPA